MEKWDLTCPVFNSEGDTASGVFMRGPEQQEGRRAPSLHAGRCGYTEYACKSRGQGARVADGLDPAEWLFQK